MIHYTCDRCKRQIDPAEQTRYVVHIEIQTAMDEPMADTDDDIDQLSELHQMLASLSEDSIDDRDSSLNHHGQYDLCPECHHQFLQNPLGRDTMLALGFSNN